MTNGVLVDNAVALPVQLIFLRQPFIAGGQALGVVLRRAVLNIELQDRVLDGLAGFRPQGGAVLMMRWDVPTGVIFGFIISAHPFSSGSGSRQRLYFPPADRRPPGWRLPLCRAGRRPPKTDRGKRCPLRYGSCYG